jgi:hypothetical protein
MTLSIRVSTALSCTLLLTAVAQAETKLCTDEQCAFTEVESFLKGPIIRKLVNKKEVEILKDCDPIKIGNWRIGLLERCNIPEAVKGKQLFVITKIIPIPVDDQGREVPWRYAPNPYAEKGGKFEPTIKLDEFGSHKFYGPFWHCDITSNKVTSLTSKQVTDTTSWSWTTQITTTVGATLSLSDSVLSPLTVGGSLSAQVAKQDTEQVGRSLGKVLAS